MILIERKPVLVRNRCQHAEVHVYAAEVLQIQHGLRSRWWRRRRQFANTGASLIYLQTRHVPVPAQLTVQLLRPSGAAAPTYEGAYGDGCMKRILQHRCRL